MGPRAAAAKGSKGIAPPVCPLRRRRRRRLM